MTAEEDPADLEDLGEEPKEAKELDEIREYEEYLEKVHLFLEFIKSMDIGDKLSFYSLVDELDKMYFKGDKHLSHPSHLSDPNDP